MMSRVIEKSAEIPEGSNVGFEMSSLQNKSPFVVATSCDSTEKR